jgi:RecA-family ATPase
MHNPYDVSEYFNLFIGSRQNIHVDNSVILHNALSDEPRPITWLLPNWLPVDKITILAGSPGVGKSTIACAIAARVSPSQAESHVSWPDSTCHYGGNVIIISTEDDYLDTILPRLKAAGADLDHVFNINSFRPWRGIHSFTFIPENITKLEREIRAIGGAALIIIDPISQIVTGDFGNNSKMRPAMEYIGRLAKKWNCAILGITHLSKASKGKDPIDRIFGTAAIGQVARSVMIAMRNESGVLDGGGTHVLVRAKGSNVNTDGGYSYRILNDNFTNDEGDVIHTSKIDWCDAVDGQVQYLL